MGTRRHHSSTETRMSLRLYSQFIILQRVLASLLSLGTKDKNGQIVAINMVCNHEFASSKCYLQVQKEKMALESELARIYEINAALRSDNDELVNAEMKKSLHSQVPVHLRRYICAIVEF